MPTVPRYERRVQEGAIPEVNTTVNAPIEAFGGGQTVQQLGEQASGAFQAAGKLYADTLRRADDAVIAQKEAALMQQKLIIDSKVETDYRGTKANEAPDYANSEWQKKYEEVSKDLSSDYQRSELAKRAAVYKSSIDNKISSHIVTENILAEKQSHEGLISNFRNAAIDGSLIRNPDGSVTIDKNNIDLFISRQQVEDEKYLTKIGAPESYKQLILDQNMSKTHEGVINKILNSNDWVKAKDYYDQNKSFIKNAEDRERIEKTMAVKELYGTAVSNVDEYNAKGMSFDAQLKEASKISNPEIRKETENRVIKINKAKEEAKKARIEANTQMAWEYLKKSGQMNDVPPSILVGLPPKEINSLRSAAEGALSPYATKTDTQVYTSFMNKTPEEMRKLKEQDIVSLRPKLTKDDYGEVEKRFRDSTDPNKDVDQSFLINSKDYILSTMKEHKLPGFTDSLTIDKVSNKKSTSDVFFKVTKDLEKEFAAWSNDNNKKTPSIEVRNQIVDDYFKRKVYVKGFIYDSEVTAGGISGSDRESVYVPISSIPNGAVDALRSRAESQGYFEKGISEEEKKRRIQRAYGAMQLPGARPEEVIERLKGN